VEGGIHVFLFFFFSFLLFLVGVEVFVRLRCRVGLRETMCCVGGALLMVECRCE
jgi:uncharacterized membrane protein YwaF